MINTIEEICIILNSQMRLFLEMEIDGHYNKLSTVDKVAIIIPDKYN